MLFAHFGYVGTQKCQGCSQQASRPKLWIVSDYSWFEARLLNRECFCNKSQEAVKFARYVEEASAQQQVHLAEQLFTDLTLTLHCFVV